MSDRAKRSSEAILASDPDPKSTVYEARPCPMHPSGKTYSAGCEPGTFSVGVGVAGSRAAALFRVKGSVQDHEQVDALVGRLVDWLNVPTGRSELNPCELEFANDKSARIHTTPVGLKARFLRVVRR